MRESVRRLGCRLGVHSATRSQGCVGYCLHGCGDLKRLHNGGTIWVRYVERPTGERPSGGPVRKPV